MQWDLQWQLQFLFAMRFAMVPCSCKLHLWLQVAVASCSYQMKTAVANGTFHSQGMLTSGKYANCNILCIIFGTPCMT